MRRLISGRCDAEDVVILAKAGIHLLCAKTLDPRFRGDDDSFCS